jgi:protein MpaA
MGHSRQSSIGSSGGIVDQSVDIGAIVAACVAEGDRRGWSVETLEVSQDLELIALCRPAGATAKRLYISSGMHGDEPAPPLAVLRLLRQNAWPTSLDLTLCPCLNPTGFRRAQRENVNGVDLNRQYHLPEDVQPEIAAHVGWLDRQKRFDAALCLHEDWESRGFYLYELLRDENDSLADAILESVKGACSIDRSDRIDGMEARSGVIAPRGEFGRMMDEWPEAIWLMENRTDVSYTLETSSADPLILRVAALVRAVNAVAQRLASTRF